MLVRTTVLGLVAITAAACTQLPVIEPDAMPVDVRTQLPVIEPDAMPVDVHASVAAVAESVPLVAPPPAAAEPATDPAPAPADKPAAAVENTPQDLWQRVRTGFQLPDMDGRLVERWEQWYSSNPDYVARMVERSSLFLYHVVEEVERRRMPAEIALLPMIESAYNPQAYSRAHASGMWQFIPSTGRIYGLRQNFWYDGRRDVLAATNAALDYLEKLYAQFGSWDLALAAYNWGEGAMSRAIAKNQARGLSTGYKSLAMPSETRRYVPKLQAVKNIIANPERYGLQLANIPNQPYFSTVNTSRHIDVKLAAELAEMTEEDFRFLNPAHKKPVIRSDGSEMIVLPSDRTEIFQRNLEAHDQPLVSWQTYTVKRSDRPEKIAAKHGITLADLKEANGITGRKRIVPGQTLLVPTNGNADPHLPDLPAPRVAPTRYKPRKAKCYVVTSAGAEKRAPCATPARKQAAKVQRARGENAAAGVQAGG